MLAVKTMGTDLLAGMRRRLRSAALIARMRWKIPSAALIARMRWKIPSAALVAGMVFALAACRPSEAPSDFSAGDRESSSRSTPVSLPAKPVPAAPSTAASKRQSPPAAAEKPAAPAQAAPVDADAEVAALREACLAAAERLTGDLPQQAEAWNLLALVQNRFGDRESAVDSWRLALHINPRLAEAQYGIGQARMEAGDARLAASAFRLAIEAEPGMCEAHIALGEALLAAGQLEEALAALKDAAERFPAEARVQFHLGQVCFQLGQMAEARAALEKSVESDPSAAYPRYVLAAVCTKLGDREAAARHREVFRQRKEADQQAERERLKSRDDLATVRQAVSVFRTTAGKVYAKAGMSDRAVACWSEAAAIDSHNLPAREQLAEQAMQQGNLAEAARWFAELCALAPTRASYAVCLGVARAQLGEFEEAEAAFQAAIQAAPGQAAGYLALAQLYLRSGRKLDAARTLVATAVEKEPTAAHFALLAAVCEQLGDKPAARAAVARGLEIEPARKDLQEIAARLGSEPR